MVKTSFLPDKKSSKPESLDCTPPDYIMPGNMETPLVPLHPTNKDMQTPHCIKVLTYSGWNPPPGNRKMHGMRFIHCLITLLFGLGWFNVCRMVNWILISLAWCVYVTPEITHWVYLHHQMMHTNIDGSVWCVCRRLAVSVRGDTGGQAVPLDSFHQGILSQPVSASLHHCNS